MRIVRVVGAVVLAALAVLAVLLARDVRSWRDALAAGDAVYETAPADARWTPSTRFGDAARAALGVDDDLALRRALQRYRATVGVRVRLDNALAVQTARARAQDALERAARDPSRQHAAQARTLLGILAFGATARGAAATQVEAAASDFTDAVRADPSYEPAKYDLELLLRLTAAHGARAGEGVGAGTGATGRRGAGGGTPGRGY